MCILVITVRRRSPSRKESCGAFTSRRWIGEGYQAVRRRSHATAEDKTLNRRTRNAPMGPMLQWVESLSSVSISLHASRKTPT